MPREQHPLRWASGLPRFSRGCAQASRVLYPFPMPYVETHSDKGVADSCMWLLQLEFQLGPNGTKSSSSVTLRCSFSSRPRVASGITGQDGVTFPLLLKVLVDGAVG